MSDTALVQRDTKFPTAQVDGAVSLAAVLEAWKERGLEPVDIARSDTVQKITIEHDPLDGKLTWSVTGNMDGLMAQLLAVNALVLMPSLIVGDAVMSIAEYFTTGAGRIDLGTGEAAVVIAFKEGRLSMDSMPKDNPIAVRKLMAAALLYLLAQDNGNPTERFLKAFGMDT